MNQQRVTYERGYKEEKIGTLQLHMIEFVTFWELQQYCGWWISISSKQCSSIVLKVHLDVVKMSVSLKEEAAGWKLVKYFLTGLPFRRVAPGMSASFRKRLCPGDQVTQQCFPHFHSFSLQRNKISELLKVARSSAEQVQDARPSPSPTHPGPSVVRDISTSTWRTSRH